MQQHHADEGVFIRSMATRGWLGGLARATMEMTMLFDAAGRDVVIVETVGTCSSSINPICREPKNWNAN
jgi:LAO/AO transport system kinase